MRNFDFYEFAGLLSPGAVLLAGFAMLYPELGMLTHAKDTSIGDLGLFVILAYVAGHLVQSISSMLEPLFEKLTGGRPSVGLQTGKCEFLSPEQVEAVKAQLPAKLGLAPTLDITKLSQRAWLGIVSQIYAAVQAGGRSARVDTFMGSYGLIRGLSAALLLILILLLWRAGLSSPDLAIFLIVGLIAALYRLHRFSVLYARELFVQFLMLPIPTSNGTSQIPSPSAE